MSFLNELLAPLAEIVIRRRGFATTRRYNYEEIGAKYADENEVCGDHYGNGISYNPAADSGGHWRH